MKSSILTNALLIIVAILLVVNLWATLSINRYHIVSRETYIFRVDKLNGTYEPVVSKSWREKNP